MIIATSICGLLAAILVDASQIASGEVLHRAVSIRGVVSSALRDDVDTEHNWLILRTPYGKVCAATRESLIPLKELENLRDAEVELTGHVRHYAAWRRHLGYMILLAPPESNPIRVLNPARDPFAAPELSAVEDLHRRKAVGSVVAVTRDGFFLRLESGDILEILPLPEGGRPLVGTSVTAVGFEDINIGGRILTEALWRETETRHGTTAPHASPEEEILSVNAQDLILSEGPLRKANFALNKRILRLSGMVVSITGANDPFEGIRLDCDGIPIQVDTSGLDTGNLPAIEPGAKIEVTGLYSADFAQNAATDVFPRLRGFTLVPRTRADIRVIRAAAWWTVSRLAIALAILAALLGFFAFWSILLRRVASRQARQLVRDELATARAELKTEERTRLAVELHDSLSQTLTGIALQIGAAMKTDGEIARRFLTTACQMLSSCRQELRGCLFDLRTQTFAETWLTTAITRALAQYLGGAHLVVRFNVVRKFLPETTVHAILRIIRELAMNAVSHGGAKTIRVAGERRDGQIRFVVADDGCGFDPATAPGPAQGHFGLQGIRERLRALGGTISFESRPGCGTRATVTLNETETR